MANYGINIDVKIKAGQLTNFNKLLDNTNKRIDAANKNIQRFASLSPKHIRPVSESFNNLTMMVNKANAAFNKSTLGTPQAADAARNLVKANEELNLGLEKRAKLLQQVTFEMKMQKLAEKGIKPATMFSGPIGPGQATSMFRGKVEANVARSREIREIAAAGSNRAGLGGGFKEFNKNVKKIQADTKKMRGTLAQMSATQMMATGPFGVPGGNIGPALPPRTSILSRLGFGARANPRGPFAMQGGASARLKGGVGSALIGGGFPALFGAGGISSAFGAIAGGAGGALAPGGGFAASIFATAIAAQIEKARAFRKEINNLNLELESMGITSTFSRKQIKELAKEFKITNDEAIKLATTFKTFGAGQADVLLSAFGSREVFDTLSGLRTTEAVLGKIEGIREEISETQRQDLLQTLATKGSLETQAKLERIIFEQRKKAFVEGEIDKIKILDIPKEFRATEALQKEFANMKRIALGSEFENTNSSALKLLETQIKINEQMQFLSEFNAPAEEIRELLNPMRAVLDLSTSIRTGFEESFKGIIKGTMSVQDAFRNMLGRIADHFLDTAARLAAAQLQRGFLGLFSNLFSFGMSSNPLGMRQQGVGASANMLNRHAVGSSAVQPVLNFANGGRPPVGRASLVGEKGPELFIPDRAGTIIPNHAMGGMNIVVNVDASGSSVEGDEDEGRALGIALSAAIETELIKQKRPGGLLA